MRRSLGYFWRQHLLVAAGAAVASAVLTGALLVGDSVRGSLKDLALGRLGDTEAALVSEGFFRSSLAPLLASEPAFKEAGFGRSASLLMMRGSAVEAKSRARASGINLIGVDSRFGEFFPADPDVGSWDFGDTSGVTAPVILNRQLATELGAEEGSELVFSIPRSSEVPRASLLGRRDTGSVLQTIRLRVAAVAGDRGAGAFSLAANQGTPKNAFVPLERLQRALEQEGKANLLLVAPPSSQGSSGAESTLGAAAMDQLQNSLQKVLALEDFGLSFKPQEGHLTLESSRFVLRDETVAVVENLLEEEEATSRRLLSYLANTARLGQRSMPYSAVVALEPSAGSRFEGLRLIEESEVGREWAPGEPASGDLARGEPAPALGEGEIYLNAWSAEDLEAAVGDEIELEYYAVGVGEQLSTKTASFRVAGIVAMEGLGADPTLTPEFPGMADADDIAAWDPPFPVDLSTIRPLDEEYWDLYRAAPKAFVSGASGQALWRSRFGGVTSLRISSGEVQAVQALQGSLVASLPGELPPEAFGLTFQPVRQLLSEASGGATEFGGLFLGFSWFLIVAAIMLVVLLFSLGIEQRVHEIGLLRAVGFSARQVQRRFLKEGLLVAALGALAGLAGAVLYAATMMAGLRTWWLPAVGSRELYLHLEPGSLFTGFLIALVATGLAISVSLRRLKGVPATTLLSGSATVPKSGKAGRKARVVGWLGGLLALGLAVVASRASAEAASGLFMGAGALFLISGLGFFTAWCRRSAGTRLTLGAGALTRVAIRNSARNPGRSILSVSLVACACYVIVVAAANRRPVHEGKETLDPGTGGFALMAQSDVPLFQDLSSDDGRFELGLGSAASDLLNQGGVIPLRVLEGDDASCLNLFRVERPRVLGVPQGFIERGGFPFQQVTDELENPWSLLNQDLGTDPESGARVLPAVADFETATWILHKKLGDDLEYVDESGQPLRLRLVGLLHASIFQSEVVVSQENLLRHFPSLEGFSSFLFEAPRESSGDLAVALEQDLSDFGLDVTTTGAKLASFKAVQNTFLSTFQTLGGLGLLLGTLGLAVILLRNVLERRGELATLRAFGFRHSLLARLIWVENLFLLLLGLGLGTGAALLSSAPYLLSGGSGLPWGSLMGTLVAIFLTGAIACALATASAVRTSLVASLRA